MNTEAITEIRSALLTAARLESIPDSVVLSVAECVLAGYARQEDFITEYHAARGHVETDAMERHRLTVRGWWESRQMVDHAVAHANALTDAEAVDEAAQGWKKARALACDLGIDPECISALPVRELAVLGGLDEEMLTLVLQGFALDMAKATANPSRSH